MTLYLISNNYVQNNLIYKSSDSLESKREKRPLSIEGEESAKELCNLIEDEINIIYSSSYASAIATSKYIADIGSLIVLIFFAAQFIAIFKETNLATIITAWGANIINSANFSGLPLILLVLIVIAIVNLS